jgi:hypothetical protein
VDLGTCVSCLVWVGVAGAAATATLMTADSAAGAIKRNNM